jgi:para-aminobenzoate synthetase/4-amino-4-deoxychorismate lyase
VNFTYRLRAPFAGDPWNLFRHLVRSQRPAYGAYVLIDDWIICSASPELFFRLDGNTIECRPMKGTAERGMTHQQDLQQARDLRSCAKNRAENVMIVDMVRNDLGRIAQTGTVSVHDLHAIEKYPTVWQMVSTVRAQTTAPVAEVFRALFPAASITGAPKPHTMEIIAELESAPRRIYTGCIGSLTAGRKAQFSVAIRTALVDRRDSMIEYGVGGGIVWDSSPAAEYEESVTKSRILMPAEREFRLLETMVWTPEGGYFLLQRHLERLAESAEYFDFRVDPQAVRRLLIEAARAFSSPHRVRLLVDEQGNATIESDALKSGDTSRPRHVAVAQTPVDRHNPFLYHKTTNRAMYDSALRAAPGYDDVILWNDAGELTESCVANVVLDIEGNLVTPPVACGLLGGTYRAEMLAEGRVIERVLPLSDLARCQRIFLVNSVRGKQEVEVDWPGQLCGKVLEREDGREQG